MKIELIYIYNLLLMMLYAITMAFSVSFFIREKNKKKKALKKNMLCQQVR